MHYFNATTYSKSFLGWNVPQYGHREGLREFFDHEFIPFAYVGIRNRVQIQCFLTYMTNAQQREVTIFYQNCRFQKRVPTHSILFHAQWLTKYNSKATSVHFWPIVGQAPFVGMPLFTIQSSYRYTSLFIVLLLILLRSGYDSRGHSTPIFRTHSHIP